jgi:PIN domain.
MICVTSSNRGSNHCFAVAAVDRFESRLSNRAELRADGTPIDPMDALIAAVVRQCGGTLITAAAHLDRVVNLNVQRYR